MKTIIMIVFLLVADALCYFMESHGITALWITFMGFWAGRISKDFETLIDDK